MLLKISDCNNSIAMQTLSRVMAISCTTADTYICRILVLTTKTIHVLIRWKISGILQKKIQGKLRKRENTTYRIKPAVTGVTPHPHIFASLVSAVRPAEVLFLGTQAIEWRLKMYFMTINNRKKSSIYFRERPCRDRLAYDLVSTGQVAMGSNRAGTGGTVW